MNGEDVTGIYEKNTATDHVLPRGHDEPSSMKHYTFPDSKPFPTDCNVIIHNPPGNNEYSIEEHRLKTFSDRLWPLGLKQKPEELAKAGFYYLGKSDQVLCFHCQGGLQNWEPNDDPWEEHAKHFPLCEFLNLIKSRGYVRKVQDGYRRSLRKYSSMSESSTNSNTSSHSPESQPMSPEDYLPSNHTNSPKKDDDDEKLLEENKRLKDEKLCKICVDNELGVVFLPCGHFVTCTSCAASLQKCPVCRSTISNLVKTYLS